MAIAHLGAEDWFRTLRAYKNAAAHVQPDDQRFNRKTAFHVLLDR
jgi:hypothetical protein